MNGIFDDHLQRLLEAPAAFTVESFIALGKRSLQNICQSCHPPLALDGAEAHLKQFQLSLIEAAFNYLNIHQSRAPAEYVSTLSICLIMVNMNVMVSDCDIF